MSGGFWSGWPAVAGLVLLVVAASTAGATIATDLQQRAEIEASEPAPSSLETGSDERPASEEIILTNGQAGSVEVVNPIDRDGDGYVSGLRVRVDANSQAYEYQAGQGQKKAAKAVAKIFGYFCTIPGCGFAMSKWVGHVMDQRFYLVPGWKLTAKTDHGDREVARFHAAQPERYPGPGEADSTTAYTIGQGESIEPIYLPVDAHSGPLSSVLDGRERTTIRGLQVETCWNIELRGGGKETGDQFCATPDEWRDISAVHTQYILGGDRFERTEPVSNFDVVRVESPELDRTATVTIDSNPDDSVVSLDGDRLGRTPWTGEVPVDVGEDGTATLEVTKDGYEPTTVERQIVDDPSADDPGGDVTVSLDEVTKPIAVHSAHDGATVTVDGEEVGTTPYAEWFWVKERPDITVDAEDYVPHTFENVEPGTSLNASLITWEQFNTGSGTTSTGDPIFVDPLPDIGSLPDLTTFSNESDEYVTDYDPTFAGDLSVTEPSLLGDLTLDTDLSGILVANLSVTPAEPGTGQPVTVDASRSFDVNGTIVQYEFDFGDGGVVPSQQPTASHQYTAPGTYDVGLTVTDDDGETAQTTEQVTVRNQPPEAVLGLDATDPKTGQALTFDAGGASDPDGSITAYEWDLGNGDTATGETLTYEYADPGDYTVELAVTDDDGETVTTQREVSVREPNQRPSVSFEASPGESGEITFDASASSDPDGQIDQYVWDFGDDTVAAGQTVTHTFAESGTYEVELMAVDDDKAASVTTRSIVVSSTGEATVVTTADPSTETVADEPTDTEMDSTTTSPPATDAGGTGGGSPGFGIGLALVAVLTVAVLARRRD